MKCDICLRTKAELKLGENIHTIGAKRLCSDHLPPMLVERPRSLHGAGILFT